jgi:transposase
MGKLIKPTDKWGSLSEIEALYKKEKDTILATKLNAIRLMMSDYPRQEVAYILDVSESSIKNWRTAWNKSGVAGLKTHYPGSVSKVDEPMRLELKEIIEVKRNINGRIVTGKLITGYLKKNTK